MKRYVLGLDLGTSGVKLCLTDESGAITAEAEAGYPMIADANGKAEQDTALWFKAIAAACKELSHLIPDVYMKVEAVALSAQMPTLVVTNGRGNALMNAVTWRDARADDIGRAQLEKWGAQTHFSITGVRLDGRYIVPMYLYQRGHGLSNADILLLSAKDYIYFALTGVAATDPTTASGYGVFDLAKGGWNDGLCASAGISPDMLPAVYPVMSAPGRLGAAAEALGLPSDIPVVLGCADSVAGAVAMDAAGEGTIAAIWGTSTALLAMTPTPLRTSGHGYFITPMHVEGLFALEADMLSTGLSISWLGELLGRSPEELLQLAAAVPRGCDGLRFHPYLAGGEQSVLWDPLLTGSICGLRSGHGAPHLARALFEGICFETRRCIDAFQRGGFSPERMVCTGHASASPFFMQLLADVCSLPCAAAGSENGSAYGAARLAGIYAGFPDVDEGENITLAYAPDASASAEYEKLYQVYII